MTSLNVFRAICQRYSINLVGVILSTKIQNGESILNIECDDAETFYCRYHCQLVAAADDVGFVRCIWRDTSGELIASFKTSTLLNSEECQVKLTQHSSN